MLVSLSLSKATARRADANKAPGASSHNARRKRAGGGFVRISRKDFVAMDRGAQERYLQQYPRSTHRFLLNDGAEKKPNVKQNDDEQRPDKAEAKPAPKKPRQSKKKKQPKTYKKPISREEFDNLPPEQQDRYRLEHTRFSSKHFTDKKRNITQKPNTGVTVVGPVDNKAAADNQERAEYDAVAEKTYRQALKQDLKHGITAESVRSAGKITRQDLQDAYKNLSRNKEDNVRQLMEDMDERTSYSTITQKDLDRVMSNMTQITSNPDSHFTDDEKAAAKKLTDKLQLGVNRLSRDEVFLLEKIKLNRPDVSPEEPSLRSNTDQNRRLRRDRARRRSSDVPSGQGPVSAGRRRRRTRDAQVQEVEDTPEITGTQEDVRAPTVDTERARDPEDATQRRRTARGFGRLTAEEVGNVAWKKSAFWRRDLAALGMIMRGEKIYDQQQCVGKGKNRRCTGKPVPFRNSNVMVLGTIIAKYALIGLAGYALAVGAAPAALHIMTKMRESWDNYNVDYDVLYPEERRGGSWGAFGSASDLASDEQILSTFYDMVADQVLHLDVDEMREDLATQFPKFVSTSASSNRVSFKCRPEERTLPIAEKTYWSIYYNDTLVGRMTTDPEKSRKTLKFWRPVLYENGFNHFDYVHFDDGEAMLMKSEEPFVIVDHSDERENELELHAPRAMMLDEARQWAKEIVLKKHGAQS